MCIFAVALWQKSITNGGGCMAREHDIKKGATWRFVLDTSESSKFTTIKVKNEATVDVLCGICKLCPNFKGKL